jgi:4-hydroxy-tetrahydrodipicolinate synthase
MPLDQTASGALSGVLSPVVTPFGSDLAPDQKRYIRHCKWLISQNCGLAAFGTNSEANSLSSAERQMLLDALVDAGIPTARMMPGTGCNSLPETVELTRHAVSLGAAGVLMLPPFYYKGVSDEGLFRYFSEVVERVGDRRLRIYLYHIPPVAQVPITLALIERLLARYPGTIVGIKDSSGDWANTKAMLDAFPGFRVFAGSETFLLRNMQNGGVGCISATANINPARIHNLFAKWNTPEADRLQAELDAVRSITQKLPMIAALKATIAAYSGDASWRTVRPPLVELTPQQQATLKADLDGVGFTMPGLALEPA